MRHSRAFGSDSVSCLSWPSRPTWPGRGDCVRPPPSSTWGTPVGIAGSGQVRTAKENSTRAAGSPRRSTAVPGPAAAARRCASGTGPALPSSSCSAVTVDSRDKLGAHIPAPWRHVLLINGHRPSCDRCRGRCGNAVIASGAGPGSRCLRRFHGDTAHPPPGGPAAGTLEERSAVRIFQRRVEPSGYVGRICAARTGVVSGSRLGRALASGPDLVVRGLLTIGETSDGKASLFAPLP